MERQKLQALIRRRAFCAAPDQSLIFLSHMNIYMKYLYRFLHNIEIIYEYRYIEKAAIGKHGLLLNKLGFPI